jgi:hypothetical protein
MLTSRDRGCLRGRGHQRSFIMHHAKQQLYALSASSLSQLRSDSQPVLRGHGHSLMHGRWRETKVVDLRPQRGRLRVESVVSGLPENRFDPQPRSSPLYRMSVGSIERLLFSLASGSASQHRKPLLWLRPSKLRRTRRRSRLDGRKANSPQIQRRCAAWQSARKGIQQLSGSHHRPSP